MLSQSETDEQHVKRGRNLVTATFKTAERSPEFLLWHRGKKLRDHDDLISIEPKNRVQSLCGARRRSHRDQRCHNTRIQASEQVRLDVEQVTLTGGIPIDIATRHLSELAVARKWQTFAVDIRIGTFQSCRVFKQPPLLPTLANGICNARFC